MAVSDDDAAATVGLTLNGDPTLEDCDRAMQALVDLFEAGALELAGTHDLDIADFKVTSSGIKVTCGICEAAPISWVVVERKKKLVRVARCAEHRPASMFPELVYAPDTKEIA